MSKSGESSGISGTNVGSVIASLISPTTNRGTRQGQAEDFAKSVFSAPRGSTSSVVGVIVGAAMIAIPGIVISFMDEKKKDPDFTEMEFKDKVVKVRGNLFSKLKNLFKRKMTENLLDVLAGLIDGFFKKARKEVKGEAQHVAFEEPALEDATFRKFIRKEAIKYGIEGASDSNKIPNDKQLHAMMDALTEIYKGPPIMFDDDESEERVINSIAEELDDDFIADLLMRTVTSEPEEGSIFDVKRIRQIRNKKINIKKEELDKLKETAQRMREDGVNFFE